MFYGKRYMKAHESKIEQQEKCNVVMEAHITGKPE